MKCEHCNKRKITMKTLGLCQAQRWEDQTLSESMAWHESTGSLTAGNTPAYKAGYEAGYRDALSALKLHGYITIDTDK